MKKSNVARQLNDLIHFCIDFYNHGFKQKHEQFDFSMLDTVEQENQTMGSVQKSSVDHSSNKSRSMIDLARKIISCTACPLGSNARQIVPGIGNINADVFVINSPVQPVEENMGKPFAGPDGDFFNKWLTAINLTREELFITNIIKCNNYSSQLTREMFITCMEYIKAQLDIVQPLIILSLGQTTLSSLRNQKTDLHQTHGQVFYYHGYPLIPTFHPLEVQHNPSLKRTVWQDLQRFQVFLKGRKIDDQES